MTKLSTGPNIVNQAYYNESYYLNPDGTPQTTFSFNPNQTPSRAQAMAEAADITPGAAVLDFACAQGGMTAAFNNLGFRIKGLDPSEWAIANAVPEARPYVEVLNSNTLSNLENSSFDLAVAKDVLEHVPIAEIPDLSRELLRVARKLLIIIPTVDETGEFIFKPYEQDPTHITRFTHQEWLDLFARLHTSVEECSALTSMIRRPDKVMGTVCILLVNSTR